MRQLIVAIIDSNEKDSALYKGYCNNSLRLSCSLAVGNIKQFLSYYQATKIPDLLLLDIEKDSEESKDFEKQIAKIKSVLPNVELVILTNIKKEKIVLRSFNAGANGYLLKGISSSELSDYLTATKRGGAALSPKIARQLIQRLNYEKIYAGDDHWESLTRRQIEIVDYMTQGLNASEIAQKLDISVNGIQYHVRHIYKKLRVNNKTELLKKYFSKSLS